MSVPKPPKSLQPDGLAYWKTVVNTFELEPHQLETLRCAAECLDRMKASRDAIATGGMFIENSRGDTVRHPAVDAEMSEKRLFRQLVRELGLDVEPAESYSRGPRLAATGPRERSSCQE